VIHQFGGIVPRSPDHAQSHTLMYLRSQLRWHVTLASRANDVKLRRGVLEAWREPKRLRAVPEGTVTFDIHDCCVRTWDSCVTATPFLPDYGRLYVAGRGTRPEVTSSRRCDGEYRRLGVPAPSAAPTVLAERSTGEDCDIRSYVYTYVNGFGEESAPSPPSPFVTVKDGATVLVTGMTEPPDGWGVVGIRMYRTATGSRDVEKSQHEPATGYLLAATLTGFPDRWEDAVLTRRLGFPLTTENSRLPPAELRHLRHLSGTGVLCGVTSNRLHFSENFLPYNWPAEFDMTFPSRIVSMVTVDARVLLSTEGRAYVIDASNFCEERKLKEVQDTDAPLPDIGGCRPHSAAATPFGMVYPGKNGLILLKPNATYNIVTAHWFSPDQWKAMRPETTRLAYWQGWLFCVTDTDSFVVTMDQENQDFEAGAMSTISDRPDDMVVTASDELVMLKDGALWQWDAGDRLRPYEWVSTVLESPGTVTYTAARVKTTGTLMKILTDGDGPSYERWVSGEAPVRVARLGRRRRYRMGFFGTGDVEFAELGSALSSMREGA
jgi:hypothetical protein